MRNRSRTRIIRPVDCVYKLYTVCTHCAHTRLPVCSLQTHTCTPDVQHAHFVDAVHMLQTRTGNTKDGPPLQTPPPPRLIHPCTTPAPLSGAHSPLAFTWSCIEEAVVHFFHSLNDKSVFWVYFVRIIDGLWVVVNEVATTP